MSKIIIRQSNCLSETIIRHFKEILAVHGSQSHGFNLINIQKQRQQRETQGKNSNKYGLNQENIKKQKCKKCDKCFQANGEPKNDIILNFLSDSDHHDRIDCGIKIKSISDLLKILKSKSFQFAKFYRSMKSKLSCKNKDNSEMNFSTRFNNEYEQEINKDTTVAP